MFNWQFTFSGGAKLLGKGVAERGKGVGTRRVGEGEWGKGVW